MLFNSLIVSDARGFLNFECRRVNALEVVFRTGGMRTYNLACVHAFKCTVFDLRRMIRSAAASLSPFLIETPMSPVVLNYQLGVLVEFVKIN